MGVVLSTVMKSCGLKRQEPGVLRHPPALFPFHWPYAWSVMVHMSTLRPSTYSQLHGPWRGHPCVLLTISPTATTGSRQPQAQPHSHPSKHTQTRDKRRIAQHGGAHCSSPPPLSLATQPNFGVQNTVYSGNADSEMYSHCSDAQTTFTRNPKKKIKQLHLNSE